MFSASVSDFNSVTCTNSSGTLQSSSVGLELDHCSPPSSRIDPRHGPTFFGAIQWSRGTKYSATLQLNNINTSVSEKIVSALLKKSNPNHFGAII